MTTLNARPEAITFDAQRSALIVVDMQNAYASKGGYLDLAGFDVSTTQPVIENIKTAVSAARAAGMLIVWFQNGWDEQYVEAKALTTHHNLALGFNEALDLACESAGLQRDLVLAEVDSVRYATTLGTNALIERKGPKVGAIVTHGFEDTIPLSRGRGYGEGLDPMPRS
jgi:hypothetical protein